MNLFPGFGLAAYRSFGTTLQRLGRLGKVNLLAGANNSGKSNVLRFAIEQLHPVIKKLQQGQPHAMSGLDRPTNGSPTDFRVSFPVLTDDNSLMQWSEELAKGQESILHPYRVREFLKSVFSLTEFSPQGGVSWMDVNPTVNDRKQIFAKELLDKLGNEYPGQLGSYGPTKEQWRQVSVLIGHGGGSLRLNWVPDVLAHFLQRSFSPPQVRMVPAFRQIGSGASSGADDLSGAGLIPRLAQLERPSIENQHDKAKFAQIVAFVREVTRAPDAMVEVPHGRDTLHVHLNGRILPLSNLGTGIHQVVLLAAAATLHDNFLLCLEEPELHLHPILQRALVRYLSNNTTNQYLISTHSASFLDAEGASVFRVHLDSGTTAIELAKSHDNHFDICANLGYHASDLLQCNAAIWVEGPSDRIYLLEWLRKVAPDLKEGLHFSIMFYGGSLLTHASTEEDPAVEFAKLRRLNRSFAIIMDSDRTSAAAPISATKQRIVKELEGHRCLAWVLEGRTIENYLSLEAWKQVVAKVHPNADVEWTGHRYQDPFAGLPANPNKIALARWARDLDAVDTNRIDLPAGLEKLVKLIRDANPPLETSQ